MSKLPVPTGKVETIYQGHIVDLRREETKMPDGRTIDFEIVRHKPAAAVLAIDDRGRAILVHQFRHALGKEIWEVPAGILEDGEAPLACAKRELEEETGFVANEWTPLGTMLTAPGFCDEVIHLYLARELSSGSQNLDDNEVLNVHPIALSEVHEMAGRGDIEDGKSIAALYRAMPLLDGQQHVT